MDDLELLLSQGTTTYSASKTQVPNTSVQSTIQKADKSAGIPDLFKMVNKLVTLTMNDLNVEFIPEDTVYKIVLPDKKIDKNYIAYLVKERDPKNELKPRVRETVVEKTNGDDSRIGEINGQKFKSTIQFNILADDPNIADQIMNRFEEMISVYTGFIKRQGIAEIVFKKQINDTDYNILRQILSVRSIQYYVETERLTVIFKEKIKEIETMLSLKEE